MTTITPEAVAMVYGYNWGFMQQIIDFFVSVWPIVMALMVLMMGFSFIAFLVWGAFNIGRPHTGGNSSRWA